MLKKLKKLSKISIELALRDTYSTLGVFENSPYLELDYTHQSGFDSAHFVYIEVKKSMLSITINDFIQLEKFQKINEFLLKAAIILLDGAEVTRKDQNIEVTKKIQIPVDAAETFYSLVAESLLAFLCELDKQLPKIFDRANRANAHDDYLEQKAFVMDYEKNGPTGHCIV